MRSRRAISRNLLVHACLLGAALAAACGDSKSNATDGGVIGGGQNTPVSTGLPASKPVASLTPAERMQACMAIEQSFLKDGKFDEAFCKFGAVLSAAGLGAVSGMSDAQLQATCKSSYDMCLAEQAAAPSEGCEYPASCTATVGEVEQCLNDTKMQFATLSAALPACNAVTKATLMQAGTNLAGFQESAACKTLEQKCPEAVPEGMP